MSRPDDKRQKRLPNEFITHNPTISLLSKQNCLLNNRKTRTIFPSAYLKVKSSTVSPNKKPSSYEIPEFQRSQEVKNVTKSVPGLSKLPSLDFKIPKDPNKLLLLSPSQTIRSPVLIKQRFPMNSARDLPNKKDFETGFNCVSTCALRTRTGNTRGVSKKTNQDAYTIIPNFGDTKGQYLFGVFDGHGVNGHHVSDFIKSTLPRNISSKIEIQGESTDSKLNTLIKLSFHKTSRELNLQNNIDISYSGSTCVAVIIRNDLIIAANLGDSRAVLGRQHPRGCIAMDLTIDHKPDLKHERNRIESAGGRVDTYRSTKGESYGPYRVWLRNQNTPGLAMSRSFGDSVVARVGVISEPEVSFHRISGQDKFVIIGSDGLWEFISSQEAVEIVTANISMPPELICDILVSEAASRWRKNEDMVDDITVLLVMLTSA